MPAVDTHGCISYTPYTPTHATPTPGGIPLTPSPRPPRRRKGPADERAPRPDVLHLPPGSYCRLAALEAFFGSKTVRLAIRAGELRYALVGKNYVFTAEHVREWAASWNGKRGSHGEKLGET